VVHSLTRWLIVNPTNLCGHLWIVEEQASENLKSALRDCVRANLGLTANCLQITATDTTTILTLQMGVVGADFHFGWHGPPGISGISGGAATACHREYSITFDNTWSI
jgi:hypothetical protein